MNIFGSLKLYAGKWSVKSTRNFSAEEIAAVDTAVVVPSEYGNSICFHMKTGGMTFIPLSSDATVVEGEIIDLSKAKLLTLTKAGEEDIFRVSI